jgi:tetratricopeptide (TPR) repeat protein
MTAALPLLVTLLAYHSLNQNGFVNWDDPETVTQNLQIRGFDPASLQWMLTSTGAGYWIPLTWFSLSLDYHLAGLNPAIFHLDSLLIHLANVLLVFLLSYLILEIALSQDQKEEDLGESGWVKTAGAFICALIFGIHPLHVESVAWASERKDVLYGFFYLLSLLFYLRYALSQKTGTKSLLLCFAFFLLSLLSKPMAVTLPLVLFILDFWPLRRFPKETKAAIREKILFFLPLMFTALLALISQSKAGAMPGTEQLPMDLRFMNAFHSIMLYAQKLVLPSGFTVLYPLAVNGDPYTLANWLSLLAVFALSAAFWAFRGKTPYGLAAWLFYLVSLLPVLGIVQVGVHAAAERYTYLPTLGLILLFSAGSAYLASKQKILFVLFSIGLMVFLGVQTSTQVGVWSDSISLWENAVRFSPAPNEIIFWNLGFAYRDNGKPDQALEAFDKAIKLNPLLSGPHYGKGLALSDKGRLKEAVEELKTAIALNPGDASPHSNLCVVYQRLNRYEDSILEAQKAIQLSPQSAPAYNNLGVSYGYEKEFEEAFQAFQQAVSLNPTEPMYRQNLQAAYEFTHPSQGQNQPQPAKTPIKRKVYYYFKGLPSK